MDSLITSPAPGDDDDSPPRAAGGLLDYASHGPIAAIAALVPQQRVGRSRTAASCGRARNGHAVRHLVVGADADRPGWRRSVRAEGSGCAPWLAHQTVKLRGSPARREGLVQPLEDPGEQ